MSSSKPVAGRKILSIVLSVLLVLSVLGVNTVDSDAVMSETNYGIYCTQKQSGWCTLASAVMMVRAKASAYTAYWNSITQDSMLSDAWQSGLKHSFEYAGVHVEWEGISSKAKGDKISYIKKMLDNHPEGIVIYENSSVVKHAVYLRSYKVFGQNTIFYCGDPAVKAGKIALKDSWNAKCHYGEYGVGQNEVIEGLTAIWYVDSVDEKAAEAFTGKKERAGVLLNGSDGTSDSESDDGDWIDDSQGDDSQGDDSSLDGMVDEVSADGSSLLQSGGRVSTVDVQFAHVNNYRQGTFVDLPEGIPGEEWVLDAVKDVYETGLMYGVSDDSFDPNGRVTLAQAVTMAARVNDRYNLFCGNATYRFTVKAGEQWYTTYLNYAREKGILGTEMFDKVKKDPNRPAARQDVAVIFRNALPAAALKRINVLWNGEIGDVDAGTAVGKIIYELYEAGIFNGKGNGKFGCEDYFKRSEAAAVIDRLGDYSKRIKF